MNNFELGKNGIPYSESTVDRKLTYDELLSGSHSYMLIGEFDQALMYVDKAILINPNDPDAYGLKGIAYMNKGDKENAIKYLSNAIAIFREMTQLIRKSKDEMELLEIVTPEIRNTISLSYDPIVSPKSLAYKTIDERVFHYNKLIKDIK